MSRRIIAITAIYLATAVAWLALGVITEGRTMNTRGELYNAVGELWGNPHLQTAPEVRVVGRQGDAGAEATSPGQDSGTLAASSARLDRVELASSDIEVQLSLDPRRKGLLWFNTYEVDFAGSWTAVNPDDVTRELAVTFLFPTTETLYDDFAFTVDGAAVTPSRSTYESGLEARVTAAPGQEIRFAVSYRSRGLDTWSYHFGGGVSQVRDFHLAVTTDFTDVDFQSRTMSPTHKERTAEGWLLGWDYQNLISGFQIGLAMPERLNPGPLAGKITFFAPVSLLFFFFVIFVLGVLRNTSLHPMHYFFLAAAFFSFHLLFAYLVDHVDVHVAFVASSLTSIALVVSYLRIVAGNRFAFVEAGLAQLIYLVLFSYTHFLKGLTGLTVTIGAILTLFVLMQATARVNWDQVFAEKRLPTGGAGADGEGVGVSKG